MSISEHISIMLPEHIPDLIQLNIDRGFSTAKDKAHWVRAALEEFITPIEKILEEIRHANQPGKQKSKMLDH